MGGVIEHTPLIAADVIPVRHGGVEDTGMAQGMFLTFFPGIPGFGGEHVAVGFGDEERSILFRNGFLRHGTGSLAVVGKIVIGIHIFQQMAVFDIPDTGGTP